MEKQIDRSINQTIHQCLVCQELTDVDTLNESEEGAEALIQALIGKQYMLHGSSNHTRNVVIGVNFLLL